jgi:hypothetical protein
VCKQKASDYFVMVAMTPVSQSSLSELVFGIVEKFMRLDHVNIHVYDVPAARAFLVQLLGVQVGWRPSFKVQGDWLYLEGRAVIHTWLKDRERGMGWVDHIAFGPCGDPDTKRAELLRLGYVFSEAQLVDTDITQFFVTGPEGMKIELQCQPSHRQDLAESA